MNFDTLDLQIDERGVATLTLNRAEKHNAMSAAMISELQSAAEALGARADLRAVVLTGSGESFCAGGDLGWMREQFAADRPQRIAEASRLAMMLKAFNELPLPLIGRVQGPAYGGGLGLISVCDVAIGVRGARFAFTETRLGLIPATISPYVLARMGEGRARRVFMSARLFETDEAVALGLLAQAVDRDALDGAIEAEIKPYFNTSPAAVAASKVLARSLGPRIDDALIASTIERLANAWESEDAAEGIDAFFARRKARWMPGG